MQFTALQYAPACGRVCQGRMGGTSHVEAEIPTVSNACYVLRCFFTDLRRVFGKPTAPAGERTYKPIEERVLIKA